MDGKLKRLTRTWAYVFCLILLLFGGLEALYADYVFAIAMGATAIVMFIATIVFTRQRAKDYQAYIRQSVEQLDSAGAGNVPCPVLTLDYTSGEILWHNKELLAATGSSDNLVGHPVSAVIPGFSTAWLEKGLPESESDFMLRGRRFRAFSAQSKKASPGTALLYFIDSTELLETRDEYFRTRPLVSIILIDNFDELTNNLADSAVSKINADINERIGKWAENIGGLLRKMERNRFLFLFESKDLYRITDEKFALLDSVREVTGQSGIAATISIGIGKDGNGFQENYDNAALALEMALSRGGDQAVIKDKYDFSFYGGRSRETERRTKVKARVVAGTLTELISSSSRVFIMGHKNADMDAIGAAAGLCALCRKLGKPAGIVTNLKFNASEKLIDALRSTPEYKEKDRFLSGQDALVLADTNSLLLIVDTNRPDQVECLELLESMQRIGVIDHHRRAADYIQRAVVSLHEPYASSASELVTEILTYSVEPADILPVEQEALLAGIVLDTKNFGVRVNSRTFEAAAFLRRLGADPVEVKKLFQSDFETTVSRYRIVQSARLYRTQIAIAAVDEEISRVLAGQAADELLNIDGIDCSFVLFRQGDVIYISGRSIGDINVQMILEALGGGGNAATAGAQVKNAKLDVVARMLADSIDRYFGKTN